MKKTFQLIVFSFLVSIGLGVSNGYSQSAISTEKNKPSTERTANPDTKEELPVDGVITVEKHQNPNSKNMEGGQAFSQEQKKEILTTERKPKISN